MGQYDDSSGGDKGMPRSTSWWSSLIFGWYTPVLVHIQSKIDMGESPNLGKEEGIPQLPKEDSVAQVDDLFGTIWKQELIDYPKDPNLEKCLFKAFSRPFLGAFILNIVATSASFVGPVVLNLMISYLQDSSLSIAYGLYLTMALFMAQVTTSLCTRHSSYLCFRVGLRVQTALTTAIFQKSLQIDSTYYDDHPIGQVINLMSVDVSKITLIIEYLLIIFTTPVTITIALIALWNLLGFSSLAGTFVIIISVPVTTSAANWMRKFMKKLMKLKDERINCNQEVLSNMKTVKYQAWEEPFRKKTEDLREAEIKQLLSYKIANTAIGILYNAIPMLVELTSFGLYVTFAGQTLDTPTALTSVSLFNMIKTPLIMFSFLLNFAIECRVALDRIRDFLMAPNFERPDRITNGGDNTIENNVRAIIDIKDGTFSYKRINQDINETKHTTLLNQPDNLEQEALLIKDSAQYGSIDANDDKSRDLQDEFNKTLSLRSVNFKCYEGEFVAIVGEVGSGKSSLLKAILGELQKVSGEARVGGSVAYFSQDPFIMNDTVKGNILFGKSNEKVDDDLYRRAVRSACLEHDLEMFSDGDQTEIGEKGINMSGGQKARISIGRVVYKDADISLLDDCLSAVDAHVGRDLFDKCIVDVLLDRKEKETKRKRTVILVTNALQYLSHPMLDRIVVLKDGSIVESGSFEELFSLKDSHFRSYLDIFNESMANESKDEVLEEDEQGIVEEAVEDILDDFSPPEYIDERRRSSILSISSNKRMSLRKSLRKSSTRDTEILKKPAKLMTDEMAERKTGKVGWELYMLWAKAAGGVWVIVPVFLVFIAPQITDYLGMIWVSKYWGPDAVENSQLYYLKIYALINLTGILLGVTKSIVPVIFALRAAVKLFSALLDSLLMAPMSFYDTTPTGRILNRFSKDVNTVDETLMSDFVQLMGQISVLLTAIFTVVTASPSVSIVLPFLLIFYKQQYDYFSQSNRELQRIVSAIKSPTYALFGEALNGFCTIRAFEAEPALLDRVKVLVDKQIHASYLFKVGKCWLGVRLEFVGSVLIFFGCLSFVLKKETIVDEDELQSSANYSGMALTYLLTISSALLYAVRSSSDFEADMVSVERIRQYTDCEKEAPHDIPADKLMEKGWPSRGLVEFKDVKLRYRTETPLVLKGLNFTVPSKSRVGIVGRTGAGKSTIVNALTRLNELDSGQIILDGVDIKTIGLNKLRSNIAVIPQDPVLFSGTVRTNLDPFNQYLEGKLMDVLGRVGLYTSSTDSSCAIKSLDDPVEVDGNNFSSGQRQLLVIARALLDGASVVICDEATSSIDAEADSRVQRVFRDDFAGSTTLTIAHRLNTILDSTHILVMSDGKAVEFDSPTALLAKGGLFKDLVDKWEEEHE